VPIGLFSFSFFAGDLLDKVDDAAPQLGIRNAHERLG
jgi:hypothetical protein